MNPIEFQNNNYASILEVNKDRMCTIQVLGVNGPQLKGTFLGVAQCKANELTIMAGGVYPFIKCA